MDPETELRVTPELIVSVSVEFKGLNHTGIAQSAAKVTEKVSLLVTLYALPSKLGVGQNA